MWLLSTLISKRKLNCKIMKGAEEVTLGFGVDHYNAVLLK